MAHEQGEMWVNIPYMERLGHAFSGQTNLALETYTLFKPCGCFQK